MQASLGASRRRSVVGHSRRRHWVGHSPHEDWPFRWSWPKPLWRRAPESATSLRLAPHCLAEPRSFALARWSEFASEVKPTSRLGQSPWRSAACAGVPLLRPGRFVNLMWETMRRFAAVSLPLWSLNYKYADSFVNLRLWALWPFQLREGVPPSPIHHKSQARDMQRPPRSQKPALRKEAAC